MDEDAKKADGWLGSLRRMGDSALGLAQSRLDLFVIELQEEKLRAFNALIWLIVALTFGVTGLLVGLGAAALYFWEVAGYFGLLALAGVLLITAVGLLVGVRRWICNGPTPFNETIGEFKKDRECLRNEP